ncbi:MAG: threonine synthase, partial [Candidatus Heimdallarchaeaceae archaeon]
MNFINTKDFSEKVSFKEATLNGLARNKGLYVPEIIPVMPNSFFESIEKLDDLELSFQVMFPYVKDSLTGGALRQILKETLSFPIPVVGLTENVYALELFHGPTQAFKDVGARFMSRCLSQFTSQDNSITVLVATSGDTGSAVAHGFYNVKGVTVIILFPKGKISLFQEYQMTSLGNNIH